jgi:hypothetical protein
MVSVPVLPVPRVDMTKITPGFWFIFGQLSPGGMSQLLLQLMAASAAMTRLHPLYIPRLNRLNKMGSAESSTHSILRKSDME